MLTNATGSILVETPSIVTSSYYLHFLGVRRLWVLTGTVLGPRGGVLQGSHGFLAISTFLLKTAGRACFSEDTCYLRCVSKASGFLRIFREKMPVSPPICFPERLIRQFLKNTLLTNALKLGRLKRLISESKARQHTREVIWN